MKPPFNKALIPVEKQFANIKRLVPEVNALISETAGLDKVYKKRFARYSEKWDLMQDTIFHLDSFKHLSEKDRTFVSTYVLGMMQKLIYAKRLSQESHNKYQVAKTRLHELLLELTKEYKEAGLRGDLPMFVKKHDIKLGFVSRKKEELRILMGNLKKRRPQKEDEVLTILRKKRFSAFLKQVFVRMHVDLKNYSQPEPRDIRLLKEKISAFKRKKATASKKSQKLEGTAYGLIEQILMNHLDMLGQIDTSFKDFHAEFCQAVREGQEG